MSVVTNGKRPYNNGLQSKADVIDLTFSDDERPSKRQRSESWHTPPPINGQSHELLPAAAANSNTQPTRKQIERSIKSKNSSSAAKSNDGTPGHRSSRPSQTQQISSHPTVQAFQKPKGLSNGISSLSLRPSPRSKQSLSPEIIDLDTDSDHGRQKHNQAHSPSTYTLDRSISPVRQPDHTSTASFLTQDIKPIRFDPTSPDLSKNSITTITPGNEANSRPSVVRKPLVQIPPRRELPSSVGAHINTTNNQTPSFQSPSKSQVIVNLPPHPSQRQAQTREVVGQLKKDVSYIRQNPTEVSKIVGVLPFDDTDLDTKARRKARQTKHKIVDRDDLILDFGSLSLQPPRLQTTNTQLVHPRQQVRRILHERFRQPQHAPLLFENRRNTRQLNGKFQFVSDYVFSKKIKSKKQTPLQSRDCECISGCGLNCACLPTKQQTIDANGIEHTIDIQTYRRREDGLVVLSDDFIDKWSDKVRIFECGEYCSCPQNCVNRVVQKGREIPLIVFETQHCGFGVRSTCDIVKGQFIDVYLGEVLTNSEVARREAAAEEDTPSYVMSLDVFIQDEQSMFYVDGEVFGSVTRFVNHSCEPNCTTLPVVLSNGTKHLYHVAFFAIKDIPAGTELTIDYDPGLGQDEEILDASVVQCRCGSANCRKRLWRPSKEKRGRKRLLPSKDDD